jgi:flagellar hook-associated protein 2
MQFFPRTRVEPMSSTSAVNSAANSAANAALDATTTNASAINYSSILAASVGATTPGIDVAAAVAAALNADRASERVWQGEVTTLSSQTSALQAIQTATTAVTNDLGSLNSLAGPLAARTVTSSNSNYVSATAATGTTAGVHTVVVGNLATTATWYSDLATSATSTLPASSFTLTNASGTATTITTGAGNTGDNLTDLASAINGRNLGVNATVVTDASGSRLSLVSSTAASAGNFTISSANYTGTSWSAQEIPTGTTLGANSITITPHGGPATVINTTSGETYAQLASGINALGIGVTATASSDANGTNLSITSSTPFTISEPSFGFNQASLGQNANLTVDGVPISSTTNTVTGAIPGVTLNLLGATAGTAVNLTVASDAAQASTAINQLVTDYNTAMGLVNTQFALTTDSSGVPSQGIVAQDSTVRSLQNALETALNYVAPPPAAGTTTISTLSNLGITMGNDGTLSVDTTTLTNALTTHPTDVQTFFEGTALNGFASSFNAALDHFTNPGTGAFTLDLNGISKSSSALTQQISDFESGYIANQQTILQAEYSAAETALQTLPTQMAQLQAELGLTPTSSNGG